MWNYKKLRNDSSPLQQIISLASSKGNIRFVIYHLGENHVEMATEQGDCDKTFRLDSSIANEMLKDGKKMKDEAIRHGMRLPQGTDNHALLAFDLGSDNVFLIQTAPEAQVVSGILMGMVTELISSAAPSEYMPSMDDGHRKPCRRPSPSYEEEMFRRQTSIDAEAREFARRMAAKERKTRKIDSASYYEPSDDEPTIGIVGGARKHIGLV